MRLSNRYSATKLQDRSSDKNFKLEWLDSVYASTTTVVCGCMCVLHKINDLCIS